MKAINVFGKCKEVSMSEVCKWYIVPDHYWNSRVGWFHEFLRQELSVYEMKGV